MVSSVASRSLMPGPGDGRGLDDLDVAAPLHGVKALLGQLAEDLVDVRRRVDVGQVDLVQGHDDRHLGGLGVGDGFDRLGHDAVVGGHDQDHDVGHVGPAGAHGGEGLVAGRVDEGDRLAVVLDLVGANVLRDAAALALDDVGLADAVQERGLAVIDVAQDRDDRRARHEVFRIDVRRERFHEFVLRGALVDDLEFNPEFHGQHGGQIVVQAGVDGGHLAKGHELAEQLIGLDTDDFGEVADRDRRFDGRAALAGGSDGQAMAAALVGFPAARERRVSSSSLSSAAAGMGEVTRRSVARSLRRARRPARSADEPTLPLARRSSSSSLPCTGGPAGPGRPPAGAGPGPGPGRRGPGPAPGPGMPPGPGACRSRPGKPPPGMGPRGDGPTRAPAAGPPGPCRAPS